MPRITRKQQKIFAENASNNGVFGSLQGNDPTTSSDPDAIQGRTAYENGWNDATYSSELLPPLEEFQALQYLFSRQIAYTMQEGISEWDASTTYYKGALVKAIQADGSFILYASLIDNNTGNAVTDTTKWVITNTSTNFHQGIPNWRADVIYSDGDWVKAQDSGEWSIFESIQNNNLNNAISDTNYWNKRPFSSRLPLLTYIWADHILNDVSWLRADTFSWQSGDVYVSVYNHLVDDIDGVTPTSETIGTYTITYYPCADGHKVVLPNQADIVQDIYNESGVAWYYILDTANQRFKLPRENPAREELVSLVQAPVVGNGMTMGMTNGTQTGGFVEKLISSHYQETIYTGLYGTSVGTAETGSQIGASKSIGLTTDKTKSGVVADLSSSTTSSVYKGRKYLYFYVGNYNQSAIEQTAGLNSELFDEKLDLDVGNATSGTKETIVGWGIPDYTAGVNLGEPSTYQTLPCDCYVTYQADNGSGLDSQGFYYTNQDESYENYFKQAYTYGWQGLGIYLSKGWKVKRYAVNSTIVYYPLKGVNNA